MNKVVLILLVLVIFTLVGCGGHTPTVTTYSMNIAVNGQGTTDPGTGTYTFSSGTSIAIKPIPATGWLFDHWSGDASGAIATTAISMDGNKNVIANFIKQPQPFGPTSFSINTTSGDYSFPYVGLNDRVEFNFAVAGAPVTYSVRDPNGNAILTGPGGNVASGKGSFIAATTGYYKLHFVSSGLVTPSVLTITGTLYFAQ